MNWRLSHETGFGSKHGILSFPARQLHPGFSQAGLHLPHSSSCSGMTHDPGPMKHQRTCCSATTDQYLLSDPCCEGQQAEFLSPKGQKKGRRRSVHKPPLQKQRQERYNVFLRVTITPPVDTLSKIESDRGMTLISTSHVEPRSNKG